MTRKILATKTISQEMIQNKIFLIHGVKVMLDFDLAMLYEVPTKRLNEQVKRNIKRFPEDFMFQLTPKETKELVANCDRFRPLKHSTQPPCFHRARCGHALKRPKQQPGHPSQYPNYADFRKIKRAYGIPCRFILY